MSITKYPSRVLSVQKHRLSMNVSWIVRVMRIDQFDVLFFETENSIAKAYSEITEGEQA